MTALGPCVRCGDPATQLHHVTGRGADSEQLDDELVLPVCPDCHDLIHEELRLEGIHYPLIRNSIIERLERRLRRLAINLARIADKAWPQVFVGLIALNCLKWAEELAMLVKLLDRWNPAWRDVADPTRGDGLRTATRCDSSMGDQGGDQEGGSIEPQEEVSP